MKDMEKYKEQGFINTFDGLLMIANYIEASGFKEHKKLHAIQRLVLELQEELK